jgi:hypothetical protein
MIKELMYKWFGLDPISCVSCEILREQLAKSDAERRELLHRLLDKDKPDSAPVEKEDFEPIKPKFMPWRVRQQILEQEDRKKAQLMKDKEKEIAELERELGVNHATQSVSVQEKGSTTS